jgi:hypothetical protein
VKVTSGWVFGPPIGTAFLKTTHSAFHYNILLECVPGKGLNIGLSPLDPAGGESTFFPVAETCKVEELLWRSRIFQSKERAALSLDVSTEGVATCPRSRKIGF